jgi:DNA-binding transcriptional LysR family regulator
VRLADLADGVLVQTQVGITTPALWPAGARPAPGPDVRSVDDWLVAIASGAGFGVSVVSTAVLHPHPDVRYVPLTDAPVAPVLLAWPRRGEHPSLRELLRVAQDATAHRSAASGEN